MMIEKKVWEGVGMSAALRDAEAARYLDPQEEAALLRAKLDFGSYCRGLAAEFLAAHPNQTQAKQALRQTFSRIESEASGFDEHERELVDHFTGQVDDAISVVAAEGRARQKLGLIWFKTPSIIKVLFITAVAGAITVGVVILVGSVLGR